MSNQVIEVQDENPTVLPSWKDVAEAVQNGSWAVIMATAIIFWWLKKPLSEYISCQTKTLGSIKDEIQGRVIAFQNLEEKLDDQAETTRTQYQVALEKLEDIKKQAKDIQDTVDRLEKTISRKRFM